MKIHLVSLFPSFFDSFVRSTLIGKAIAKGSISFSTIDPRDFSTNKHRSVDDAPYGGGSGMVLMPEPIVAAMESVATPSHRVLLTPQGQPFDQCTAERLSREPGLTFACGRYEGFDERIRDHVDSELSLGDFVMLGGEVAAMAVIEATVRLLPGVIGNPTSLSEESHGQQGLLEYPQYTRPAVFRDRSVPAVLMSGNHAAIAQYRLTESVRRTHLQRPDLLAGKTLSPEVEQILNEMKDEAF